MKTLKIINKIAILTAIAGFLFTAIQASLDYFTIIIVSQGQEIPMEYVALTIFSSLLPYLFVGVVAAIVTVLTRESEEIQEESSQEEDLPPVDTEAEVNT